MFNVYLKIFSFYFLCCCHCNKRVIWHKSRLQINSYVISFLLLSDCNNVCLWQCLFVSWWWLEHWWHSWSRRHVLNLTWLFRRLRQNMAAPCLPSSSLTVDIFLASLPFHFILFYLVWSTIETASRIYNISTHASLHSVNFSSS